MAVTCGTPTPATTRVVQIEPGPMPTLTPSAPASIRASRGVGGGDVAGDRRRRRSSLDDLAHDVDHAARVAVGGVDHEHVDAGVDERLGPLERVGPTPTAAAAPQAALLVLGGVGVLDASSGCP